MNFIAALTLIISGILLTSFGIKKRFKIKKTRFNRTTYFNHQEFENYEDSLIIPAKEKIIYTIATIALFYGILSCLSGAIFFATVFFNLGF